MNEQELAILRRRHEQDLAEALQHIVARLAQTPDVQRVILFGSYAQGRCDLLTDLDILIVMESPLDFVTRTAQMYRLLSTSVDMDILAYTSEEFERNRHRGFIRQALKEGRVIYEKHRP